MMKSFPYNNFPKYVLLHKWFDSLVLVYVCRMRFNCLDY